MNAWRLTSLNCDSVSLDTSDQDRGVLPKGAPRMFHSGGGGQDRRAENKIEAELPKAESGLGFLGRGSKPLYTS